MDDAEKQEIYPSPPPPYSLHDANYADVNLLKEKVSDDVESKDETSFCYKRFFSVIFGVLLTLGFLCYYFFIIHNGPFPSNQNAELFHSTTAVANGTIYVLQLSDLFAAVPYSYVSHSNITPICMYGEDNIFNVVDGRTASSVEGVVFNGVIPSTMSRISNSKPIDSSHMECRSPPSMTSERLLSNAKPTVLRNARLMQKPKALQDPILIASIFFNQDSLLYSEIEDLVGNSGQVQIFAEIYSIASKLPSSLLERAKRRLFKQEPPHWNPTPTRVSDLSFQKDLISNSTFPILSKSEAFNTAILRFRYILETESFFLSSFASQAGNSSLIRLSQSFLNDLGVLFRDESAVDALKVKYGTHVFQSGTLGGYLDILIEIDLTPIRDPLLEQYYKNLKFCLGYQFSMLLSQLYSNATITRSLVSQATSAAFFSEFSKRLVVFVHQNPKCYPICRLFNASDLLFPSNFKSLEIRSSHMDHWSHHNIQSSYDAPTFSSGKLVEVFRQWYNASKCSPKIIRGQLIPLHDLLNIYVVPFQQQYYLWTLSRFPTLSPIYANMDDFFSAFDDKLLSQELAFDKPVREIIASIEEAILKLFSLLKKSKSKLESDSSFIPGSSFNRVPSFAALVARQEKRKDAIVQKELCYEKEKISVLDIFVKISKPDVNSSILTISTSFQKSFSPGGLLDWSLYPNPSDEPLSFASHDTTSKNLTSPLIVGQQLEAFPTGFRFDTMVSRAFSFEANNPTAVKIALPIGFFPAPRDSNTTSFITKDLGLFLPLDDPQPLKLGNSNASTTAYALPVPARSVVLSFAPIDLRLFNYFSKYDNYSRTKFLDTHPPIYLSDFSIRIGSLTKLFSLKKNSFESSQEARFSPFVSSVVCPAYISLDLLDTSSSYNSYQISKSQAALGSRCFSLIVDLPEPSRVLAIKCQKNTPADSNAILQQKLDLKQRNEILMNIPYHCQLAYLNENN